jgi:hypothetical protein
MSRELWLTKIRIGELLGHSDIGEKYRVTLTRGVTGITRAA